MLSTSNSHNVGSMRKNFSKLFENRFCILTPLIKKHKADILKTHGSNSKISKYIKIKYTNFYDSFYKTFSWYKKNNIHKL